MKSKILAFATDIFSLPIMRDFPPLVERAGRALQHKPGVGTDGHEHEAAAALRFIWREQPVIIDGGANVGRWTQAMIGLCPGFQRIIMFEPQPACWPRLESLASERVLLQRCALSNESGKLKFWANANSELASFHRRTDFGDEQKHVEIDVTTLDLFMDQHRLDFVDFVKLDLEGHETFALEGARNAIESRRIGSVSFEFGMANVNSRTFFIDFWEMFHRVGWRIYRILPGQRIEEIASYSRDYERFFGVENYIASPKPPKGAGSSKKKHS
jgi:FkbM family methyltransferase